MKPPVYLDHAATTPVDARVAARMTEVLTDPRWFGNSASDSHDYGEAAAGLIELDARRVRSGQFGGSCLTCCARRKHKRAPWPHLNLNIGVAIRFMSPG